MASEYRDDLAAALARADAAGRRIEEKDAEVRRHQESVRALAAPVVPGAMICRGCGHVGPPKPMSFLLTRLYASLLALASTCGLAEHGFVAALPLVVVVFCIASLVVEARRPARCPRCHSGTMALLSEIAEAKAEQRRLVSAGACADCGRPVDADTRYCQECGKLLEPASVGCAACGEPLGSAAKFCKRCGARV